MSHRVVAIHQPNFFPWLGFFDKLQKSDVFVILDDVQIQKTGSSWCNRVAVNIQGKKSWLTAPIQRNSGLSKIKDIYLVNSNWQKKIKKTLEINYAQAKNYHVHDNFIFELIDFSDKKLINYNINAISKLCQQLNIDFYSKAVFASSLDIISTATQRLIDITKAVGGNAYLTGGGACEYLDEKLIADHGLTLIQQNFIHPVYHQHKTSEFIYGLSVIDYLLETHATN